MAIDVNTAAGGTVDPWGRQLEWSLAANKPDFIFYVNLDNNWQGGLLLERHRLGEPGPPAPGALGWITGNGFSELAVLLGSLGVAPGSDDPRRSLDHPGQPDEGPAGRRRQRRLPAVDPEFDDLGHARSTSR